jgi:hypothetical protein
MRQILLLLKDEASILLPQFDDQALKTLKFAELLPAPLAVSTLAKLYWSPQDPLRLTREPNITIPGGPAAP